MKFSILVRIVAAALALTLLLTACAAPVTNHSGNPKDGGKLAVAASSVKAVSYSDVSKDGTKAAVLAEKINAFSREMLAHLDSDDFVFSPISVYLALAVLSAGAQGETLRQLQEALYPKGMDEAAFNKACGDLLALLTYRNTQAGGGDPSAAMELTFSTLLCTDDAYTPAAKVADIAAKYFAGSLASADYDDPAAKELINAWAEQATKGLIKNLISEPIDPETVMILASSIYFSNQWVQAFRPEDNQPGVFNGLRSRAEVTLMQRTGLQNYYENDLFQALRLNYQNGACMDVILPKAGVSVSGALKAAAGMNLEELYQKWDGTFRMPKFNMDFRQDLKGILGDMGMSGLFKGGLSGLVTETPNDLFVSEAYQKARIEVDEKGTKAAAVTVAMIAGAALQRPQGSFDMICDRPFGYLISGSVLGTKQLLFAGSVSNL